MKRERMLLVPVSLPGSFNELLLPNVRQLKEVFILKGLLPGMHYQLVLEIYHLTRFSNITKKVG